MVLNGERGGGEKKDKRCIEKGMKNGDVKGENVDFVMNSKKTFNVQHDKLHYEQHGIRDK